MNPLSGSRTPDYALILAAGQSRRMGRPKAFLPWLDEKPLVAWMTKKLTAAGWQPRAVLGPALFEQGKAFLPADCAVLNPHPETGKSSSLRAGLTALPAQPRYLLISAVDQPRPPALYRILREKPEPASVRIWGPDYQNSRGHPVVVDGELTNALIEELSESTQGLRGFLNTRRNSTHQVAGIDPSWLRWDLNTPEIYQEALAYFQQLPEDVLR